MVTCLGQGADLHMAHLRPLPLTVSCSSKSRLVLPSWFYLYGTAYPGSPGQNPESHETVVVVVMQSVKIDLCLSQSSQWLLLLSVSERCAN